VSDDGRVGVAPQSPAHMVQDLKQKPMPIDIWHVEPGMAEQLADVEQIGGNVLPDMTQAGTPMAVVMQE
jgi:hypothetical protein